MNRVLIGRVLIAISLLLQFLNIFLREYLSASYVEIFKATALVLIVVGLILVLSSYFSKKQSE